jgi:hypothetical protein
LRRQKLFPRRVAQSAVRYNLRRNPISVFFAGKERESQLRVLFRQGAGKPTARSFQVRSEKATCAFFSSKERKIFTLPNIQGV